MRTRTITAKQRGFTLIEFLVVVVIVAAMVAILLPALQQSREQARRTQCRDNLKQFGLALHNYNESHRTFPPGVITRSSDTRQGLHSGLVFLLPMLGHESIYNQYDFDVPWTAPKNLSVAEVNLEVFRCPNTGGVVPQTAGINVGSTDYAFSKGPSAQLCVRDQSEGMFDVNSLVRINDVSDGLSNTFAIGEAASDHLLPAESP